jgi:hypothetical protein
MGNRTSYERAGRSFRGRPTKAVKPTERRKTGAAKAIEQQNLRRAEFCALPQPALIPDLGLVGGQMLLEFPYFGSDHELAVPLSWILREIVLVIVFCRIEMF